MNWKMMTLTFFELYAAYIKKLGQFFFHTYSLTCLNKDTLVLIKVKIFEQVKYKNIGMYYVCMYLFHHHKKMFKIQIKRMAMIRYYMIK